jgi:hypothetical protein
MNRLTYISRYLKLNGFEAEASLVKRLIKQAEEEKQEIIISFIDNFDKRHIGEGATHSQFNGTKEELEDLIRENLDERHPSPQRKDTFIVPLPPDNFRSGLVTVDPNDPDVYEVEQHQLDNPRLPLITTRYVKNREKPQAKIAQAVIKMNDLHYDERENAFKTLVTVYTLIVSDIENEPMNPQAMERNRSYGMDPRSEDEYQAALEESKEYWANKAVPAPKGSQSWEI